MRKIDLTTGSIALGATVLLGAFLLAPAAEADTQAARSRSSASSSSSARGGSAADRASAASAPSSSSSSSRGAAVTRSSGRRSSPGSRTVVRGTARHRVPTGGHRVYGGYNSYRYDPYYPYYYRDHYYPWGWSFGLGWWGGYYYSPYYGLGYPYYTPHAPYYGRPYSGTRIYAEPVGAFDLNVKPKRTEVWVDGRFVGTVGRFDGFPDYLWLAEGEHQLVFFLEGHVTVERQVETLAGVVADLRLEMEPGPSTPPRQLASEPPPPAYRERPPAEREEPSAGAESAAASAEGGTLDLRPAPGRLVVSVEPDDASVYLDGKYLGTGRDLARLHAGLLIDSGPHRLEIVRPGYEDQAVEFSVAAGEEERIEIGLEGGSPGA